MDISVKIYVSTIVFEGLNFPHELFGGFKIEGGLIQTSLLVSCTEGSLLV
jgi:hypothetical protein